MAGWVKNDETHWSILAFVRFFLAIVVALGHYVLFVRHGGKLFGGGYLNPLSSVFGFFVLSGYSISASLARSPSGFLWRRVVRIWPLYLAAIAFGLVVNLVLPPGFTFPLGGTPEISLLEFGVSLLMLQNMLSVGAPMIIGVIWSLSTEWWLYVVAPILQRLGNALLVLLGAASFVFFIREHQPIPNMAAVAGWSDLLSAKPLLGLAWIWIVGFLYYRGRDSRWGVVLLFGPGLVAAASGRSPGNPYFITVLILVVSGEIPVTERLKKCLDYLGDLSYPIYLVHFPTLAIVSALGVQHQGIFLGAVLFISASFLHVVDYPSRRLFRRHGSKRVG